MMGKYSIKNRDSSSYKSNPSSSSYDSAPSSSTVHLLQKTKNKKRNDNEDLATIIRNLVDNQKFPEMPNIQILSPQKLF